MKKLWRQNRVLLMLLIILFTCFIAIMVVALTFFYSKDVSSYGSRLDDISKYEISKDFLNDYKEKILANEGVNKVTINNKGRIYYVHITFDENISLDNAKKIAESSLELFGEKNLSYYDIEFSLRGKDFVIFGAKNSVAENISWNNNRDISEDEEEENEE